MATIAQIVQQIRSAVYGREVRENIAQGIETCYSDIEEGVTWIAEHANTVIQDANNAAESASIAQQAATTATEVSAETQQKIDNMTATAAPLVSGSRPTVVVTEENGHKVLNLGIPNGQAAAIIDEETLFQNAPAISGGTVIPTGEWLDTQPTTDPGDYLWIKKTLTWNTGDTTVLYNVSRMGIDGDGTYSIQIGNDIYQPDGNQKIVLPVDDVPTQNSNALVLSGAVASAANALDDRVDSLTSGLAIVQNGDTATENISAGDYVVWNGVVRKATSWIAIGDELNVNNLVMPDKGAFNDVGGKVVSTLAKLVEVTSRTPNVPVLLSLPSGSEAGMVLLSGDINGTTTGHCECIARYYNAETIDCFCIAAAGLRYTRYNSTQNTITHHYETIWAEDLIKIVTYSYQYYIEDGKTKGITQTDLGVATPSGYKFGGISSFTSGSIHVSVSYINPTSSTVMGVRNNSGATRGSAASPITAKVGYMYIKKNAFAS